MIIHVVRQGKAKGGHSPFASAPPLVPGMLLLPDVTRGSTPPPEAASRTRRPLVRLGNEMALGGMPPSPALPAPLSFHEKRGWGSCGCSFTSLVPPPCRPRVMNQTAPRAISLCGCGREGVNKSSKSISLGGPNKRSSCFYMPRGGHQVRCLHAAATRGLPQSR